MMCMCVSHNTGTNAASTTLLVPLYQQWHRHSMRLGCVKRTCTSCGRRAGDTWRHMQSSIIQLASCQSACPRHAATSHRLTTLGTGWSALQQNVISQTWQESPLPDLWPQSAEANHTFFSAGMPWSACSPKGPLLMGMTSLSSKRHHLPVDSSCTCATAAHKKRESQLTSQVHINIRRLSGSAEQTLQGDHAIDIQATLPHHGQP